MNALIHKAEEQNNTYHTGQGSQSCKKIQQQKNPFLA